MPRADRLLAAAAVGASGAALVYALVRAFERAVFAEPNPAIGAGVAGLWASFKLGRYQPSEGLGVAVALVFSIGGLGLGGIETLLYFFARSLGHVSGPF